MKESQKLRKKQLLLACMVFWSIMRSILNYIYSKITSRGRPKIRKWGVQINPIKLFSCPENGPKPKRANDLKSYRLWDQHFLR